MLKRSCTILSLATCLAVAGAASAQASSGDAVSGSGTFGLPGVLDGQLSLSATSAADGRNPAGEAEAATQVGKYPFPTGNAKLDRALGGVPFTFGGRVTCLRVSGNRAVIKYQFDHADPSVLKGGGIEIFITDGGPGRNDTQGFLPPQDALSWKLTGPSRCDSFDLSPFQTKTGDYTVTDR